MTIRNDKALRNMEREVTDLVSKSFKGFPPKSPKQFGQPPPPKPLSSFWAVSSASGWRVVWVHDEGGISESVYVWPCVAGLAHCRALAGKGWFPMAKKHEDDGDGRLKRKQYEKELRRLQGELCRLQDWVKYKGLRVIVIFEGRDAAGKGGTIRAITERVSPRVFRLVALPAPSDREKTQMYMQRYMAHFPASGEIVIFDRSWYNRAGVEYVMGFCTPEQYKKFLELCPISEKYMIDGGIILIKYWMEVGQKEQERRFEARIKDPLRQWKLSPMDLESFRRWYEYSRARDAMLEATDTKHAPWHIVRSDDKKRARLNCITHLLSKIPYGKVPREKVKLPKRKTKGSFDDQASLKGRHLVAEKY